MGGWGGGEVVQGGEVDFWGHQHDMLSQDMWGEEVGMLWGDGLKGYRGICHMFNV